MAPDDSSWDGSRDDVISDPDGRSGEGMPSGTPDVGPTGEKRTHGSDEDVSIQSRVDGVTLDRPNRWRGGVALTLTLLAVGLATQHGPIILAAAVPLSFLAYEAASSAPDLDAVAVTRRLEPHTVAPGRPVRVTLEVTNEGDRIIPDLRVADGVPRELAVRAGSPRGAGALEPGGTLTAQYLVVARRGEYDFGPVWLRGRGLGPTAVSTGRAAAAGDTALECRLDADALEIAERGSDRIGQLTTDRAGAGLSFHSIREFHPDDPADRIAWRYYAKHDDLATVNYDRDLTGTVVLVLDARAVNRVAAGPGHPTAVELAAYAATSALETIRQRGHDVGVAVLGADGDGPAGLAWIPPGSGPDRRHLALETFRSVLEGTHDATDVDAQVRKLLELTPADGQLALFSPALEDASRSAVETWVGAGIPVILLSPDVLPENTTSGVLDQVDRRTRLAECQARGARVVDWRRGTPLPHVLERAFAPGLSGRLPTVPARRATGPVRTDGGRDALGTGSSRTAVRDAPDSSGMSSAIAESRLGARQVDPDGDEPGGEG